MAHCLCFLHQLVPQEPLHSHPSGRGGCPTPPVLTVTCQARPVLENKELSLPGLCPLPPSGAPRRTRRPPHGERSLGWHRPTLAGVLQDRPLPVPSVPRTELDPTCLPYWTRTWRARAGTAHCPCAGRRAEAAGRLSTNWRRNSCPKCLTLFKHFSFFKGEQIKTLCLPLRCLMLLCLPKLWPRSYDGNGHATLQTGRARRELHVGPPPPDSCPVGRGGRQSSAGKSYRSTTSLLLTGPVRGRPGLVGSPCPSPHLHFISPFFSSHLSLSLLCATESQEK